MTKRPIGAPSRRTEKPARCGAIWGGLTCALTFGHRGSHRDGETSACWHTVRVVAAPPQEPGNG